MWYQSEFPNTRPDWITRIQTKTTNILIMFYIYFCIEICNLFCRKMEGVEAFDKIGSQHDNPNNIYVELNNPPSELLQIVKELKDELQTVKMDNERIVELNQM